MSLLRFLGLGHDAPAGGETETVRRVVAALERMEPHAARHVACFAYVLGRVAGADRGVSPEETRVMERIVMERGGLTAEQAATVVQIAQRQQALFGGTEDYLVTREFASGATRQQKLALLDCCMAVAAANADVSVPEDDTVRKIASELGLSHVDFVAARASYREYLAVLKTPSGTPEREFSTERRARRVTTTPWAIAGGRIDVMPESPVTSPDDPGSPGRSRAR